MSKLSSKNLIFGPIVYILFFGLLCLWVVRRFSQLRISFKRLVGRIPSDHRWLPTVGLVISLLVFMISVFLLSFNLVSLIAPKFVESLLKESSVFNEEKSAPIVYKFLMVFVLVIMAPIVEELIFRGIILHRWAAKWGIRTALIGSSFVFGIIHTNVVGLSVFGLVMGLLYIKTRTLIVPIICHSLNNAIVSLSFLSNGSDAAETVNQLERSPNWGPGVLLMVLSAPWVVHFIYKNWPSKNAQMPYFVNALDIVNVK